MPLEHTFAFPLARGLHARPATALRERAQAFKAECVLFNERNGRSSDLRDLLSLIATDTGLGDPCRLTMRGSDAGAALESLATFLAGSFLEIDEDPPQPASKGIGTVIPQLLGTGPGTLWAGQGLSPGVGEGVAFLMPGHSPAAEVPEPRSVPAETEIRVFHSAMTQVERELAVEIQHAEHPTLHAILEAHRAMLDDRIWRGSVAERIREQGLTARSAVLEEGRAWAGTLEGGHQPLLRERAADLRDLTARLARALGEEPVQDAVPIPDRPYILVLRDLPLNQFLNLDRRYLRGLALTECGATSHLAILARTFGIPLVAGIPGLPSLVKPGQPLLVDGTRGAVIAEAPKSLRRYFAVETASRATQANRLQRFALAQAHTRDGRAVSIQANLALTEEASSAFDLGAEGVGLFRTEMLFLDRNSPPSEEEQFQVYRSVLAAAGGRAVTLRLLDVGGDKPLPYLELPPEQNPFLGQRAVRLYPRHLELIRPQIRATIRAAASGQGLRVMVPMVSDASEMEWVRALFEEEARDLRMPVPPLGAMVEVPAAAMTLSSLSPVADFFCVGTNDLLQFLFAADRGLPACAKQEHAWHPATLRLLDLIIRTARSEDRPLSLCGEMASEPKLLPLLVGLGFEALSVAPSAIAEVKGAIAALDASYCETLATRALGCRTAEEVHLLLQLRSAGHLDPPVVETSLVDLRADCATREEAIKRLVEMLFLAGRTTDPASIEEAVWARERLSATGMGYGFAVPHCLSKDLRSATLAVLRLPEPIAWGPPDEPLVHTVLLLALPGEETRKDQPRLFARLARQLMNEAFRRQIEACVDSAQFTEILRRELI